MLSILAHLVGVYTLIGAATTIYLYTLEEGWEGYSEIESVVGGIFWPWMFQILWRQGNRPWHPLQRLVEKLRR